MPTQSEDDPRASRKTNELNETLKRALATGETPFGLTSFGVRRIVRQELEEQAVMAGRSAATPQPDMAPALTHSPDFRYVSIKEAGQNRRAAVDAYIEEVFRTIAKRITRTDIWKSARYKTRTEFERWQRNDPTDRRKNKTADERFTRILTEKPHLK